MICLYIAPVARLTGGLLRILTIIFGILATHAIYYVFVNARHAPYIHRFHAALTSLY